MIRSALLLILLLVVGIYFVHEGIVFAVHHGLVGVDGHVVQVHGQHYLLLHDGFGGVIGQLDVEKAGVGFGQSLVLVFLVGNHGLNHEADIVSLEFLAVDRQTFLAPAEPDDLQPVHLLQFLHDFPEEFDPSRFLIQSS